MINASPEGDLLNQIREALNFGAKVETTNLKSVMTDICTNVSKLQKDVQKISLELAKKADSESTAKSIADLEANINSDHQTLTNLQTSVQDMKNDMSINYRKILSESKRYTELLLNDFRQEMEDTNNKNLLIAKASGADLNVLSKENLPEGTVPVISAPHEEENSQITTPPKSPKEEPQETHEEEKEYDSKGLQIRVPSPAKEMASSQTSIPPTPEKGSRPPSRPPEIPPDLLQRLDTLDFRISENDQEIQRISNLVEEIENLKKMLDEQNAKFGDQSLKLNEELENLKASAAQFNALSSSEKISVQPSLNSINETEIEEKDLKIKPKTEEVTEKPKTPVQSEEKEEEKPSENEEKSNPEDDDKKEQAELEAKLKKQQEQMMAMINNSKNEQIDTTELMKQIMDAVRFEIEINTRQNNEKTNEKIRQMVNDLNNEISGNQNKINEIIKGYDEKLLALQKKSAEDLNKFTASSNSVQAELKDKSDQLQKSVESLNEKVKSMSATSNLGQKITTIPIKEGKADLSQILAQLGNAVQAITELDTRLAICEKSSADVSQETIKSIRDVLNDHDGRLNGYDSNIVGIEMKIGALGDRISELKGSDHTVDDERKFNQIRELIANLEDSTKSLRDSLTKVIQDNATERVSQMMQKTKVEEHTKSLEDLKQDIAKMKEENSALSSRLKKVISLIQNINTELSEKINNTSNTVTVYTEEIEKLKNMLANTEKNFTAAISATNELLTARNEERPKSSASENRSPSPPPQPALQNTPTAELRIEFSGNKPESDEEIPPTTPVTVEDTATSPHMEIPQNNWVERPLEKSQLPKLKQPKQLSDKRKSARSILGTVDQKKFEESNQKVIGIESSMTSVKSALDTLRTQTKSLTDTKADKDAVQSLYEQLKSALAEMNNRLGSFRRLLGTKVDASDLQNLRKELLITYQAQGETAAGTENIRCLLCGQIRKGVTGTADQKIESQIKDAAQIADKLGVTQTKNQVEIVPAGPLFSSSVGQGDEEGTPVYIYTQNGEMYKGRSMEKQRIVPAEGPIVPDDAPLPNL